MKTQFMTVIQNSGHDFPFFSVCSFLLRGISYALAHMMWLQRLLKENSQLQFDPSLPNGSEGVKLKTSEENDVGSFNGRLLKSQTWSVVQISQLSSSSLWNVCTHVTRSLVGFAAPGYIVKRGLWYTRDSIEVVDKGPLLCSTYKSHNV